MANQEHLAILKQGVEVWNGWRKEHLEITPDLREADLSGRNLTDAIFLNADLYRANLTKSSLNGANLNGANLEGANLSNAGLRGANFTGTNLKGADLSHANLENARFGNLDAGYVNLIDADLSNAQFGRVDLGQANLSGAKLSGANLVGTNLRNAFLNGTDFAGAIMAETVLGDRDLRVVKGLEAVQHRSRSPLSINSIYLSEGQIPEIFLQGTGAPDTFIEYVHSLTGKAIAYYSCFISYSSQDEAFARRLYADLQSHNVRCWFAPQDMKIGDKIRPRIDESIRLYDKLLLVLSEHSVVSQWVEHEVETAIGKELEGKPNVLFPIRLDQAIMDSKTGWASHIRLTRHIGDFTKWKNHDDYQKGLNRLLRDLKAST